MKNWSIVETAWDMFEAENADSIAHLSAARPSLVGKAYAGDLGRAGKVSLSRLLEPEICFSCELPSNLASVNSVRYGPYFRNLQGYWHGHSGWMKL